MITANGKGVLISGIIFDAGSENSPLFLRLGSTATLALQPRNSACSLTPPASPMCFSASAAQNRERLPSV